MARFVAEIQAQRSPRRPTLETARAAHEADMADLDAAGRYALALFRAEQFRSGRELAEKVNAEKASQPDAALVMAAVALNQNFEEEATRLLVAGLDESAPHADVLASLARLRREDDKLEEAARLYRIGTERFPGENRYWNGLAITLWKTEDSETLRPVLETIAGRDFDNVAVRKRLGQIAQQAGRLEEAVRWGEDALCIDIEDAEVHKLLAECYEKLDQRELAAEAWQAVLELTPDDATAKERVGDKLRDES
jgi:tetratricopeptide (TPR) repeat protein